MAEIYVYYTEWLNKGYQVQPKVWRALRGGGCECNCSHGDLKPKRDEGNMFML